METHFIITSTAFSATEGEIDEEHEDFINPGQYALELADFLERELSQRGYAVRFRCQEDWGHWMELDHDGKFTLAVCCSNVGDDDEGQVEHRIFLVPDKPIIRKFLKKINVQADLEKLAATLRELLENSPLIEKIRIEDGIN